MVGLFLGDISASGDLRRFDASEHQNGADDTRSILNSAFRGDYPRKALAAVKNRLNARTYAVDGKAVVILQTL